MLFLKKALFLFLIILIQLSLIAESEEWKSRRINS